MPAYFVGEVNVTDPDVYAEYAARAVAIIEKYGGKTLAKGGKTYSQEGSEPAGRIVIIEFPDAQAAEAMRNSPEYQEIIGIRQRSAEARVYVVEGF